MESDFEVFVSRESPRQVYSGEVIVEQSQLPKASRGGADPIVAMKAELDHMQAEIERLTTAESTMTMPIIARWSTKPATWKPKF